MLGHRCIALVASLLAASSAAAESAQPPTAPAAAPTAASVSSTAGGFVDLGIVRYRDPEAHHEIWLGFDLGGVYIPRSLGLFDRTVGTLRSEGSWAIAFARHLAAGGRHGIVFYHAGDVWLQVAEHTLEVSTGFLPRIDPTAERDRLALTVEMHSLDRNWVDGEEFAIGGVDDSVYALGYGTSHRLSKSFDLGWNVQGRYVSVFLVSQRQVRAAVRPAVLFGNRHRLALELVLHFVHRDEDQFGEPFPRASVHAGFALEHDVMSKAGIGMFSSLRYATDFMSGRAPMYEVREESMRADYGEALAGIRLIL